MHVKHTNTMQWEQQSIDTKYDSKHHKANKKTNINKNNELTSWNPPLIHVLFATRGQHPKKIIKRNKSYTKKIDKNHVFPTLMMKIPTKSTKTLQNII